MPGRGAGIDHHALAGIYIVLNKLDNFQLTHGGDTRRHLHWLDTEGWTLARGFGKTTANMIALILDTLDAGCFAIMGHGGIGHILGDIDIQSLCRCGE